MIDTVLHFTAAMAPTLHRVTADPLQGDIDIVVRGFKDLSPKPLAERFREMQASGGNIEIKALRLERTDAVVVGAGTLTVNEHGRLDGTINVAVAGIENIVPLLGIDQLIDQGINRMTGSSGQPGQGIAALDRLVPGLSGVVRQGAAASVIDNLKKMGQPTEIDKKPATLLPLRFSDGAVYLGDDPRRLDTAAVLETHRLRLACQPTFASGTESVDAKYGLMSSSGVSSRQSSPTTERVLPSMRSSRATESAMGLGRAGERSANVPFRSA